MLHKPRGYVTTLADPEGRPTVRALADGRRRALYPVGRLDFNTEGLLICSPTTATWRNALMHPKHEVREDLPRQAQRLLARHDVVRLRGHQLDGGATQGARGRRRAVGERQAYVDRSSSSTEGRNRQVHRMMEAVGQDDLAPESRRVTARSPPKG